MRLEIQCVQNYKYTESIGKAYCRCEVEVSFLSSFNQQKLKNMFFASAVIGLSRHLRAPLHKRNVQAPFPPSTLQSQATTKRPAQRFAAYFAVAPHFT